jgi:DNA-directed RNA polymerase specialized sigma24 family protein
LSLDTPWTLSGSAFDRLLALLDDDRESAAQAYGQLRTRVAGLMRWWGAADPDALADVVLDRAARKLHEGADVDRGAFGAYVRGVARLVFYEASRLPAPVPLNRDPIAEPQATDATRLDCLDACLDTLSPEEHRLVLRYYERGNHIATRRSLAAEIGVSPTALRIRTHRLRVRLEACVSSCVQRQ